MKKRLSILLSLALLFTSVPLNSFAYNVNDLITAEKKAVILPDDIEEGDYVDGEIIAGIYGGIDALKEELSLRAGSSSGLQGFSESDIASELDFLHLMDVDAEDNKGENEGTGLLSAVSDMEEEIVCIRIPDGVNIRNMIDYLNSLNCVDFAEYNYINKLDEFVGETKATESQWAYNGNSKYGMGNEGTPLWDEFSENLNPSDPNKPQMVVAVLDSGVYYNHADLDEVMWNCPAELQKTLGCGQYGFNAFAYATGGEENDIKDPYDGLGHGTHVAGIIAAEWDDKGISGIANNPKLMSVKASTDDGRLPESAIVAGFDFIERAVKNGVNVVAVNCSWSGSYHSYVYEKCIKELGQCGVLCVFSAGNDTENTDNSNYSNACFYDSPYVVVVNAHDADGNLASFTNYGMKSTHISAPGVQIYSTVNATRAVIKNSGATPSYLPIEKEGIKYYTDFNDAVPSEAEGEYKAGPFTATVYKKSTTTSTFATMSNGSGISFTYTPTGPDSQIKISFGRDDLAKDEDVYVGLKLGCTNINVEKGVNIIAYKYWLSDRDELFGNGSINITYTNPTNVYQSTIRIPKGTRCDGIVINAKLMKNDSPVDPESFIIDDLLLTHMAEAYAYMSGTSMSAPAVTGEAAVIAHYKDMAESSPDRAKELQARILGSAVPFKNDSDKNKNRTGGYASLARAIGEAPDPVPQIATYDKNTKTLKIEGYFFTKAGISSSLLVNGKEIAGNWASDGKSVMVPFASIDTDQYEITVKRGIASGRNFFFIHTENDDNLFSRIEMTDDSDEMFFSGELCGLCGADGNLYALTANSFTKAKDNGLIIWKYDLKGDTVWKRVTENFIIKRDHEEIAFVSNLTSSDGKLMLIAGFGNALKQVKVYLVLVNPKDNYSISYVSLTDEAERDYRYPFIINTGKQVVAKLVDMTNGGTFFFDIKDTDGAYDSLYSNKFIVAGDMIRDEEGDLFTCGKVIFNTDPNKTVSGLVQWTVDKASEISYKITRSDPIYPKDVPSEQVGSYWSAGVKGGIMSSGIKDGKGHDTFFINGYGDGSTISSYGKKVDTNYLIHPLVTTYDGKYYVLADTLTGATGRRILAYTEVETLPDVGDTIIVEHTVTFDSKGGSAIESKKVQAGEKVTEPSNPTKSGYNFKGWYTATDYKTKYDFDTPVNADITLYAKWTEKSSGGGSSVVPSGGSSNTPGNRNKGTVPTYSDTWFTDQFGVWRITDRKGNIIKNAWLCDDAIIPNGKNIWYLLGPDGAMVSVGLVQDATGNYYSLETEHNGYFGSLRYVDGYYKCGDKNIYLTFSRNHDGSFGAITNAEAVSALMSVYGVIRFGGGNETITYTSAF